MITKFYKSFYILKVENLVRKLGFDAMSSESDMEKSDDELSFSVDHNDVNGNDDIDEPNFLDSYRSYIQENENVNQNESCGLCI